ncbi:MAG: hypothetical protein REH79_02305 [Spiroplasma sp.]|nr:hypothetical protein [Spiroplasma sp.]
MASCAKHQSKKNCAWKNTKYHRNHPKKEQYRACFACQGLMNKGAYLGEQPNSEYTWNIHHKDSNPKNGQCKNLIATHPECNVALD